MFVIFGQVTYPNMMEFFESLGVDMETSDMSFSVSLEKGNGCEWGSRNGLSGLFAQKRNLLNPYFYQMIREIIKFKGDVLMYLEDLESNPEIDRNETLGHFIKSHGYSELFQKAYIVPMCASIWSSPSEGVMGFSAYSILSFCHNHHLLQLFGRPQWLTVRWRSHSYVNKVREELEERGCQIRTGYTVQSVATSEGGCTVTGVDGSQEMFDACIFAVHSVDALSILGKQATYEETRILGAFQYVYSDVYLHRDKTFMPKTSAAWSAWNFLGTIGNKLCLTYWLNVLQNITETGQPFLVTLNPPHTPDHTLLKWTTSHPVPSVAASKASLELNNIQGKRRFWFCGAYQGYGFHEDGLKVIETAWQLINVCLGLFFLQAGMVAAHSVIGKSCVLLRDRKHMVPSMTETGARLFVTKFLARFITTGRLTLLEEGGTIFSFEGTNMKCPLQSVLRVHNPQFYWKEYNVLQVSVAMDLPLPTLFFRGWWTPLFFTAGIASAKYFLKHISRQNTLTQARRNISRHYDLSNDLFGLFLDETMTYSSAIFKSEEEDLKVAQLRKISLLIEKARISNKHEILEIGSGWGSLAIEVVKQTGCKYTGITLSEEQLKYAERKVKEAGLQDRIRFLLCDYRQLPKSYKYDRIISCEMIEAVGHEFMEEFFGCCDSVLAEDGLLVVQFISIPDERYEEYRRSSDFIKEYIFPGGCLPSLSRITSAMATATRLCVEHLENIGIHYYQTLRYWRTNFMAKQSKILMLGFDEKFIRTWEYYFVYCAAGFRTRTLGNYQIVFSRPGNHAAFRDPYKSMPSS
ncbi:hypothetical protein IFM89_039928 [Coptis chinensis]|uniref:Amine oxidase domain-containing protein n=1 Tax=Coptis chinensis TaxID=261450 RepID=A0A835L9D3_9MAGN|nr:hypothetical protein IFM89_039928 [Coptis chinensis]